MTGEPRTTVLFPGAGSFGSEFRALTDALRPASCLAKYPGRFGKSFGIPAESFEAVVRTCVDQVRSQAGRSPVLFGHSFGGYLAYATAVRLRQAGVEVAAVVVAGADSPDRLTVSEPVTETAEAALAYLERTDPTALADVPSEDWRQIVAETLLQDMRLLRQFTVAGAVAMDCPILAVRGADDPLTSDLGMSGWQQFTDGEYLLQVFPGGHSDYLQTAACSSWYRQLRDGLG